MPVDRFLHPRAGKSHKVTMLTDLEYRVWTQYLLSADDFGVMRGTALALQNDNDHLANRPAKALQRCLDALVKVELIRLFTHQGKPYVFQPDWQTWQKVEYPRATLQPVPPSATLELCDEDTRKLFGLHPGGKGEKFAKRSGTVRKAPPEYSEGDTETSATNAGVRTREVANGYRLVANGLEGGPGETDPPMDVWFRELQARYPQHRVTRNVRTEHAFVAALQGFSGGQAVAWVLLQANLELNIDSHEWRVKGMVPSLEKYLAEGRWQSVLPPAPPAAEQVSPRTARMLGAV